MKNSLQVKPATPKDLNALEKEIGRRIRQRRLELGLTQQELADKLGLSYQQVQKYETGLNRISAGRLFLVSKFLMTKLNYFFEFSPNEEREITSRRAKTLVLTGTGIPPEVQNALATLIQALGRATKGN